MKEELKKLLERHGIDEKTGIDGYILACIVEKQIKLLVDVATSRRVDDGK